MFLKKDPLNLIITGVGGQGNVVVSLLIGRALVAKDYFVTIGETYGASQRGGPVMSHVRVSKRVQYGPLIPEGKSDVILGLEPVETMRVMGQYGNPNVLIVVNTRPIYPLDVTVGNVQYPSDQVIRSMITELSRKAYFLKATDIAVDLGAPIFLNIVMTGALLALNVLPVTKEDMIETLKNTFSNQKLEINLRAFQMGMDAIREQF
jgi:indolepyruvate ferredoxin oxidoreductase beta subunit